MRPATRCTSPAAKSKTIALKALYATQAYAQAGDAYRALQGGASQTGRDDGINLQIGIGGNAASNIITNHDDTTYGSTTRSNGNFTIAATGGDLNLIGSHVAGQDVSLAAAHNLNSFAQKQDASVFANPQQADVDFYIRNGIAPATPEQATAWEAMRIAATKKAAEQAAVISGTSILGPAMSAYATGGTTFATFLAGRTGAGLIGASADALAQGIDGKNIDPFSVGISFVTGSLGAGRGLVSNVGLNAAGAATNVWMNNLFYGTNENMADAARNAAIASAIGYGVGYAAGASQNKLLMSNEDVKINTSDWISIGPGMYAPSNPYPSSYILSNIAGSTSEEFTNWLLQQKYSNTNGWKK